VSAVHRRFAHSRRFENTGLSSQCKAPVVVEIESVNPLGCFKALAHGSRCNSCATTGSYFRAAALELCHRETSVKAYYAGLDLDVPVTVFMLYGAIPYKTTLIRHLGANVIDAAIILRNVSRTLRITPTLPATINSPRRGRASHGRGNRNDSC
jgi:hypothetical protein